MNSLLPWQISEMKKQTLREDAAHLLLDEARILDGELPADAKAFSQRLARVMQRCVPKE